MEVQNKSGLIDHTGSGPCEPFYRPLPESVAASQMSSFMAALQARTGIALRDYADLHAFSVRDYRMFWRVFIDWSKGLDYTGNPDPVSIGVDCEGSQFFPQVQLNYADNLLGLEIAPACAPALSAYHADGRHVRMTRGELRDRVSRLACALQRLGLRDGDRVIAVMRNDENAVVIALAVAAIGATLSSASPEMGTEALLDRFEQVSARMLFAHTRGLPFDTCIRPAEKVCRLAAALSALEGIVSLDDGPLPGDLGQPVHSLRALIDGTDAADFIWQRFPFNQPLFIMFSSGTTGKPKCIVHGAGGALIEHLKEHRLHSDLRYGDKLYFHTSCAWMMWNWQLSALASGVEIVTYDGPLASVDTLWRLVADEKVTVFGTSPAYLKMCSDAALEPGQRFDLQALRAMISTGAVLFDAQYHWVRDKVKPLPLQSISGGTDILGCFVLGNPNLPVYAGQAQCKSLALDVQAWENGGAASGVGELVCANPFPSRPLGFLGDPDGSRFHAAYFAANPGVWTHGDLIEFSPQGSARLHGRADGVLNVRGINVGPGEIYRVLSEIDGIREAMVVQQTIPPRTAAAGAGSAPQVHGTAGVPDRRVVLLLVLQRGVKLSGAFTAHVRRELARRASTAHVPDVVMEVDSLPVTHSGKPSEAAVRNAVNGLPIANTGALRNPECLEAIRRHPALSFATRNLPAMVGDTSVELEDYLQALWESLFDFSPIGRDDNFFDLGGDSLLASALIAQIQQATGRTISLATLMVAPTIAGLAAQIRSGAGAGSSQIIVPMRPGSGTPVFWLHSMAGSVVECLDVVNALRDPHPFYGIHAPGLSAETVPLRSVPQMAALYVAQMRSVQPHGPYSLIGYSFGGLVAFEMAHQLHRAGERIDFLCLLDTYVHERCLPWDTWLRYQSRYVRRQWTALRDVPRAQRMDHLLLKLAGAADKIRMRFGCMARRPVPEIVNFPPVLQRVREAMRVAMATYRPRAYYGGPVHYVRAAQPVGDRGDPMPLWRNVARRGLAIVNVNGSHVDMILGANAQPLAAALDRVLTHEIPPVAPCPAPAAARTDNGYA